MANFQQLNQPLWQPLLLGIKGCNSPFPLNCALVLKSTFFLQLLQELKVSLDGPMLPSLISMSILPRFSSCITSIENSSLHLCPGANFSLHRKHSRILFLPFISDSLSNSASLVHHWLLYSHGVKDRGLRKVLSGLWLRTVLLAFLRERRP